MYQYFVQPLPIVLQALVCNAPRTKPNKHITIDSIREFRELTEIKLKSKAWSING